MEEVEEGEGKDGGSNLPPLGVESHASGGHWGTGVARRGMPGHDAVSPRPLHEASRDRGCEQLRLFLGNQEPLSTQSFSTPGLRLLGYC